MKLKTLNYCAVAIMLTTGAACSGKQSGTNSDSATTDTAQVETKEVLKESFSTPDLTFAEVTGHVKKITNTFDNKEYVLFEFDDDGFYKSGSCLEHVRKLKRDEENRIIGGDNGYYVVTWENGRVKQTITNESDGTLLTDTFYYDEKGNLTKMESLSDGPDGEYSYTLTYSYDPDSFDEHGNWVSRNVVSSDKDTPNYQEIRRIYYK